MLNDSYEKIPNFLLNRNKTFLPVDKNCHSINIRDKTLILSREKKWFECREEKYESEKMNGNCVVCLNDFEANKYIVSLNCGHSFHKKCLIKWISRKETCPLCLSNILTETIKRKPKVNPMFSLHIGRYGMTDYHIPNLF